MGRIYYCLAIFVVSCGFSTAIDWEYFLKNSVNLAPKPRIIGGDVAVPHAYPYQVGLLINGDAFCGGSLISENYVLTAAHCAEAIFISVDIILGAQNITANELTQVHLTSSDIIIHEDYNYTSFANDIALIKLASPAHLNDVIKTIRLPSRSDADKTYINQVTTSTGWGLINDVDTTPTINDMSSLLRVVNVSVISLSECEEYYNDYDRGIYYVTENNICTSGAKDKGTCNGDSGGPLVLDGVQLGIVSIGSTLCEICSPSIFTNVGKFLDWIQAHSDVVIS